MVAPASVTALLQFGAALNTTLGRGLVWNPGPSLGGEVTTLMTHADEEVVAVSLGTSSGSESVYLCLNLAQDTNPRTGGLRTMRWTKLGAMELAHDRAGTAVGELVNRLRLLRRLSRDLCDACPAEVDLTPTEFTVQRVGPYNYEHRLVLGYETPVTAQVLKDDGVFRMASALDTIRYPLADFNDEEFRASLPRSLERLLGRED